MNVKEKLIELLYNKGIFESDALEIIELAIPELDKLVDDYKISYNAPSIDYPDVLYSLWFVTIKKIALKWIDENKPMAWYREMFI